jgi:hypothetical protein
MRPIVLLLLMGLGAACDHGIEPPDQPAEGTIRGVVTYADPDAWPSPDSLFDLRFVAMRFVPQDTSDFIQLNRLVFSHGLRRFVAQDTFTIPEVEAGTFVYSGVAQQYTANLFDWKPIGLYEENCGIFQVRGGETTHVAVTVDFRNPPDFPPPPGGLCGGTAV